MKKLTEKRQDLGNGLVAVEINRRALQQQGSTLQEVFSSALKAFDKKEAKQSSSRRPQTVK